MQCDFLPLVYFCKEENSSSQGARTSLCFAGFLLLVVYYSLKVSCHITRGIPS